MELRRSLSALVVTTGATAMLVGALGLASAEARSAAALQCKDPGPDSTERGCDSEDPGQPYSTQAEKCAGNYVVRTHDSWTYGDLGDGRKVHVIGVHSWLCQASWAVLKVEAWPASAEPGSFTVTAKRAAEGNYSARSASSFGAPYSIQGKTGTYLHSTMLDNEGANVEVTATISWRDANGVEQTREIGTNSVTYTNPNAWP